MILRFNRMIKFPTVGITSMINGMTIHATQKITEDISIFLIAVITECTYLLSDNLWFREYIEIQEYCTSIEKDSGKYRMCKEIHIDAPYMN